MPAEALRLVLLDQDTYFREPVSRILLFSVGKTVPFLPHIYQLFPYIYPRLLVVNNKYTFIIKYIYNKLLMPTNQKTLLNDVLEVY